MTRLPLLFALVAVATALGTRAQAQNYPWCATYGAGFEGTNCGFSTFAQCMADVSGIGGFCAENNMYHPPAAPAPRRLRHRKQS